MSPAIGLTQQCGFAESFQIYVQTSYIGAAREGSKVVLLSRTVQIQETKAEVIDWVKISANDIKIKTLS